MTTQRQPWLDIVRLISIFLVVLYHTPPRFGVLDEAVILNLRVPVFFCVSGFLFNDSRWTSFRRYACYRGRQILVPYVIFFAVFYVLWLWVGRDLIGGRDAAMPATQPLLEMLQGDPRTIVAPFWYIACLLTMQLLYFWLVRWVPRRWVLPVALTIALSTYWMSWNSGWVRLWNFGNALLFMPFYALGHSLRPWLEALRFDGRTTTVGLLAVAAASMAAMTWVVDVKEFDPGLYSLLRVLCGLLVIPAYLCAGKWVAQRLGSHRWIEAVVLGGTIYLGLQNYVIGIIRIGLEHWLGAGWMEGNAWVRLPVAVAVMALIYPVALLVLRHAPWVIGRTERRC